jgi:hypothetical protein
MARYHKTDGSEHYKPPRCRLVDGVVVEESDVVVHQFSIGDSDDPDIIAGFNLAKWQDSEAGQWVFEHCVGEPYWVRSMNTWSYAYQYRIMARLRKQDQTFFELKFR